MNMNHRIVMTVMVVVSTAFLFVGCAKKPVETAEPSGPVAETQMPASEPSGYQDGSISESAVQETETDRFAEERTGADTSVEEASEALDRIFFEFDQYTLTAEARKVLSDNAEYLKNNPEVKVLIEGHTDERGSDEYNLALGEKRAMAVKNYMTSLGVEPDRLSVISYGEELPLDPGHGEEAWSRNRRAEFKPVL